MTMSKKRIGGGLLVCTALAAVAACGEKGLVYGDANSVIAVMAAEQWDVVSDDVYDTFEKTITTVRDEKTFTVTYQEPYAEHWANLRRFRQMLLVGTLTDAWVQEVLDEADEPVPGEGTYQVDDVWARGQTVTLVVLPEGWSSTDLAPYLAEAHALVDGQFREYARNRMYMSGADTALADTLSTEAGFHLDLPKVYRWHRIDSVFVFRNDNPDPSELIREIAVTWYSPAAVSLSAEEVLRWRADLVAEHYSEPQDVYTEDLIVESLQLGGHEAIQFQAQWRNPPELGWPAGGPFITRAVTCAGQDRTYLIDAWLYAPGKEKYEYMIQLETVLDSFRCAS
jgi:hypothetical protein